MDRFLSRIWVPVGANMGLLKHWKPIVDKFHSKLSSWKARTLSFGGRVTLIKSVLHSLPTYYMSLFKTPQGILDELEKISRRFLWGGSEAKSKIHWVEWGKVCAPISKGGLGVGSLKSQNLALLIKWWWRLYNDRGGLWKSVISSVHNLWKKPVSYLARKHSNGVWCNIAKAVKSLGVLNIDSDQIFKVVPGPNFPVSFWKDKWCGDIDFQSKFPLLYKLEKVKCCMVTDRISTSGFNWGWCREPSNAAKQWELLQMYRGMEILETVDASKVGFRFLLTPDGDYVVKVMRCMIDSKLLLYTGPTVSWSNLIPLKVRCFVWRAMLGRIPVAETLVNRGVVMESRNCPLCHDASESLSHLFLDCDFTKQVFFWIFRWCGIRHRSFSSVLELTEFAANWGNTPLEKELSSLVFSCLIWCIWLARNDKIFKKLTVSPPKTADNIISTFFMWFKNISSRRNASWVKWSCSPFSLS